jgi:hypothetical protein
LAFELKEDQVYDKPVPTYDGAAVMQLKSKEPAKRADFDKDKLRLLRQLRQVKATETLEQYVKFLRDQVGDGVTFDKALVDSTKADSDDESKNDDES